MRRLLFVPTLLLLVIPGPAAHLAAQGHTHDHTSPYAGFQNRDLKALAEEEVEGLLAGAGLGMALAAELNGYPGPLHVLEMASMLELSEEQETAVRSVFEDMQGEARTLGNRIVEMERKLDRTFAERTITEEHLRDLLESIGQTRARLRLAHLRAHLTVLPILTPSQRERYAAGRRYGG